MLLHRAKFKLLANFLPVLTECCVLLFIFSFIFRIGLLYRTAMLFVSNILCHAFYLVYLNTEDRLGGYVFSASSIIMVSKLLPVWQYLWCPWEKRLPRMGSSTPIILLRRGLSHQNQGKFLRCQRKMRDKRLLQRLDGDTGSHGDKKGNQIAEQNA